jgi:aspartokinase-like uncharacterized kinase
MTRSLAVVKVGGSLYALGDLGPRLQRWLDQAPVDDVVLVPGGGPTADVIRDFDRVHRLGEERAHWLALGALRLNADFLARLLPSADVIPHLDRMEVARSEGARMFILDPYRFAAWDKSSNPLAALPHRWSVTSDAIAARAAVVFGSNHLILLKSVTIPEGMDWEEAGERGFVDEWFARTVRQAGNGLLIRSVNLRTWQG